MGTAKVQALGTKRFRQNQALFRRLIAVEEAIKKHIFTVAQPLFLSPPVDQLTSFGQANALQILYHLFNYYRTIDGIEIKENPMKIVGPYNPAET